MSKSKEENKDVVRRSIDAINEWDEEAFRETHTEDVVLHVGEDVRGSEAVVASQFPDDPTFPDRSLSIDAMIAEDGMVAARWTFTGTHESEGYGADPTGKEIETRGMAMFRMTDGLIDEVWLLTDQVAVLEQLDVTELPRE